MPTPFGTLYTSNITPDPETGIGKWTSDQFYQMMHNGRFPDGGLIYPAMPFASYTKVTREDSDAIFAYLRSIPPVKQRNRPHDLRFPYNNRSLILGWRTLFFNEGEFKPDPTKSAEWNRGAYLVEGLGHCGMCHTADQRARRQFGIAGLRGRPDPDAELVRAVAHLEQGGRPRRLEHQGDHRLCCATGVSDARRGLRADGGGRLQQPAISERRRHPRDGGLSEEPRAGHARRRSRRRRCRRRRAACCSASARPIYDRECASCHGAAGLGMPPHYPPLAGNQSIQMGSAVNPIRMVLNGGYPPGTAGNPMPYGMPPFAQPLSDDEVAAVVTYIRTAWGNRGAPVSARQANELRSAPLD